MVIQREMLRQTRQTRLLFRSVDDCSLNTIHIEKSIYPRIATLAGRFRNFNPKTEKGDQQSKLGLVRRSALPLFGLPLYPLDRNEAMVYNP